MRTNDLITMLASGNVAVEKGTARRRLVTAFGWGLAGALLMMLVFLGVRPDLKQTAQLPMFWAKLLVPAVSALAALHLARQLSTPGTRVVHAPKIIAAMLLLTVSSAAIDLFSAPAEMLPGMVFVGTWKSCALNITLLSLPLLAASLWATKGLAPTRPRLTGGAAGFLAGAGAAAVYALHCPEMTAVFLGTWYVLGIAIPTIAGAALGRRVLEW